MARGYRFDEQFEHDLRDRVVWLWQHRSREPVTNLRQALRAFLTHVTAFPGAAVEVDKRGPISYRVRLLGEPLPYLVYYSYDEADEKAPVILLMLVHEAQERERFDPSRFQ